MATFTKVLSFPEAVAEKVHNLGSDQIKIALTNTTPNTAWTKLSDLTEISYTNLSGANPLNVTTTSSSSSGGTYTLVLKDLVLTATGEVGPFRYVYVYNDTASNKELIGYVDYGSSISLADTQTFTIDFGASTITLA
jgi:hypothetical protein